MTATVTYATVNGRLMMENRGGVKTEYISDTLGNLIQCRDMSGNKTYEAWYWSYGEVRASTGTNPSPWGFVGLLGYYTDALNYLYVRARYYRPNLTRWQTVDPLWPWQPVYLYSLDNPAGASDLSGKGHPPAKKPPNLKCPSGFKPVWISCYGYNAPGGSGIGNPSKICGGCRKPRPGDCAIDQNNPQCPLNSPVTIIMGTGKPIRCRVCDTGEGHGGIDVYLPTTEQDCNNNFPTGWKCIKCG